VCGCCVLSVGGSQFLDIVSAHIRHYLLFYYILPWLSHALKEIGGRLLFVHIVVVLKPPRSVLALPTLAPCTTTATHSTLPRNHNRG